jgi:hypothetical protein
VSSTSEADRLNHERHIARDGRFLRRTDSAGRALSDFHDAETEERQRGLLLRAALKLKNDGDEAAGRL